ncbi:MAG: hypothetical protein Q9167_003488 [Letrouitia subvulpina]
MDNPVESEYILMEEATGTQLDHVWEDMEFETKLKIIWESVLCKRRFPGCEKAEVVGNVPQSLKEQVESTFVVGPVADKNFWGGKRSCTNIDRGPWRRPQDYLKAISQREIAWLSHYAVPKSTGGLSPTNEAQGSPDAHIALYKKFQDVADSLLPSSEELAKSTIWHWDVHTPNIFVDQDKITSLIDWQDHYETLHDEAERARIRAQVEKSIVLWAYETDTKEINQVLHKLYHIPHGRTRRDTVQFSTNTWDRDIIPFRHYWDEISTEDFCPIKFTVEELEAHARDGVGWNETADFWTSLEGFVNRDGWTTNENFERAVELFAQLKDQESDSLEGED